MIGACAKCEGLFNAPDQHASGAPRVCPRCLAVSELLLAAAALNSKVRAELDRSNSRLLVAGVRRDELMPLVDRTTQAIERARSL